jgi:hypothetical protein
VSNKQSNIKGIGTWFTPVILASWEAEIRRIRVKASPIWKNPSRKRTSEVASVVTAPASKCEALISNPSATKNTKTKN